MITAVVSSRRNTTLPGTTALRIQPARQVILPQVGIVRLACNSSVPLRDCQFVLPTGEVVDFRQGRNSTKTKKYNYDGPGLEQGICGLDLVNYFPKIIKWDGIVECRVRTVGSNDDEWQSLAGSVRVSGVSPKLFPVFEIQPKQADLVTGDDIIITCNAAQPIEFCHFYLPGGRNLTFDQGRDTSKTADYQYHGAGLQSGECGVKLTGVDERLNGYVVCKLGKRPDDDDAPWQIDVMKIRTVDTECPPLSGPATLAITCEQDGDLVECAQPQEIGTVARLTCKPGHIPDPPNSSYNEVRCKPGAKWDKPVFNCVPGCGRRNTNTGVILVSKGEEGKPGEFPWHVGIYESTRSSGVVQICGGSLITTKIVISAAHCFWDNQRDQKRRASLFKVAAGKQLRVWTDPDPNVQRRDVSSIALPHQFNGRHTHYASDIALLKVSEPFLVTARVGFICMDWDAAPEDEALRPDIRGIAAGWGYTESDAQSDNLKYVELPYVSTQTCYASLSRDLQKLLTHDKFCAGFVNKSTSVCGGDSGGGLVFSDEATNTYYLRGVVSLAFTPPSVNVVCYSQQYTGFTLVSKFSKWIKKYI